MNEAQKVKDWIASRGLNPAILARLANVPIPSVYRFVKGERTITVPTLEKIQKAIVEFESRDHVSVYPKRGRPKKKY